MGGWSARMPADACCATPGGAPVGRYGDAKVARHLRRRGRYKTTSLVESLNALRTSSSAARHRLHLFQRDQPQLHRHDVLLPGRPGSDQKIAWKKKGLRCRWTAAAAGQGL
ncbi:hypothetical protein E2562_011769 [Oryza meyeriana var. granulata]|uniref:Uncharacterized protein n=1 Tax=Oryza meyeriana var. granulata TaxID=110450 RepID=A0A6G1CP85_9ORYZ|nr:hypothetical protein E2562_011769 [Oryza meyeriana var. granulata]